jgi:hypothetical protein
MTLHCAVVFLEQLLSDFGVFCGVKATHSAMPFHINKNNIGLCRCHHQVVLFKCVALQIRVHHVIFEPSKHLKSMLVIIEYDGLCHRWWA